MAAIIIFGGLLAPIVRYITHFFLFIFFLLEYSLLSQTCLVWQLELKLGLGGTSYADFIRNMHLPMQLRWLLKLYLIFYPSNDSIINDCCWIPRWSSELPLGCSLVSQVDPIVASFSGGAVGMISALMLIEANNVEQHEKKKCKYCAGKGVFPFFPIHESPIAHSALWFRFTKQINVFLVPWIICDPMPYI